MIVTDYPISLAPLLPFSIHLSLSLIRTHTHTHTHTHAHTHTPRCTQSQAWALSRTRHRWMRHVLSRARRAQAAAASCSHRLAQTRIKRPGHRRGYVRVCVRSFSVMSFSCAKKKKRSKITGNIPLDVRRIISVCIVSEEYEKEKK